MESSESGVVIDIPALEAELDRLPAVAAAHVVADAAGAPLGVEVQVRPGTAHDRVMLDVRSVIAVETDVDLPLSAIHVGPRLSDEEIRHVEAVVAAGRALEDQLMASRRAAATEAAREDRWRRAAELYRSYLGALDLLEEYRDLVPPAAPHEYRASLARPPVATGGEAPDKPAEQAGRAKFDLFVVSPDALAGDAAAPTLAAEAPGCRPGSRAWSRLFPRAASRPD